ncbi:unnamed protein product [Lota lota]
MAEKSVESYGTKVCQAQSGRLRHKLQETDTHTHTHIHTHTHTHTLIETQIETHTSKKTATHTHTHTHIMYRQMDGYTSTWFAYLTVGVCSCAPFGSPLTTMTGTTS